MPFSSNHFAWPSLLLAVILVGGAYWAGQRKTSEPVNEPLASPLRLPAGIRSPLTTPTAPVPVRRLVGPWEPQRALVVALTPAFMQEDSHVLAVYHQLLRQAARFLDIVVMVPSERPDVQVRLRRLLEADPQDRPVLARLHFLPANNYTIWARDFLPVYALGPKGRLILLDSENISVARNPGEALRFFTTNDPNPEATYYRELQQVIGDDISPAFLAGHLRQAYRFPIRLVRPPLALDGGDFIQAGPDDVILSESTLRFNGGNEDEVARTLHDYYGINRVHYLPTLPGYTIDHLDFILMPAGPDTMLVAAPPPETPTTQIYDRLLSEQVRETLRNNTAYLRDRLSHLRLIEVPTPPPIRAPREKILARIRRETLERIAGAIGLNWADLTGRKADDPLLLAAKEKLEREIARRFGDVRLDRDADLDRVTRSALGESLASLESSFVEKTVIYRTYLNAVQFHTPDGRSAVLIPRYTARSESERDLFADMEPKVLAAFRQAFPKAELLWLNCDGIIEDLGAVHCITHTVPDWASLGR